jgi:hypothetical protein
MKIEIMKKIKNLSVETVLVFIAICFSLIGFAITVMGAFLNGLMMLNGSLDLSKGFGIILIGNSVALLGVIIISSVFIFSIFNRHLDQTKGHI